MTGKADSEEKTGESLFSPAAVARWWACSDLSVKYEGSSCTQCLHVAILSAAPHWGNSERSRSQGKWRLGSFGYCGYCQG